MVSPHHRVTASLCQSVIWLAHCHHISQSFDFPSTPSSPHYHISQSFNLPSTTASLHYHISQSFDLPPTTTSVSHLTCPLPLHHHDIVSPHYCFSQSFDFPTATTSVSHLTCLLPPYQSVIWLALYHCVTVSPGHCITALPHNRITMSVSHLTCPLPPHQSVIWLVHCHHITQSFHLPSTTASPHHGITTSLSYHITTSVSLLTCPLPLHHHIIALSCQSVIWLAHCHHIS